MAEASGLAMDEHHPGGLWLHPPSGVQHYRVYTEAGKVCG